MVETRDRADESRRRGSLPNSLRVPSSDSRPPLFSVRSMLRWAVVALLAGFLLFAHLGCHGDEDNELFAIFQSAAKIPR